MSDVYTCKCDCSDCIYCLTQRAEAAEHELAVVILENRGLSQRAEAAERERDSIFSSVPTPRMNADAARIAQLEAALREAIAQMESDAVFHEYDRGHRSISEIPDNKLPDALLHALATLRPAEPKAKHPADCLCNDCVKLVKGKLYYSDGKTLVPEADHSKGGGT